MSKSSNIKLRTFVGDRGMYQNLVEKLFSKVLDANVIISNAFIGTNLQLRGCNYVVGQVLTHPPSNRWGIHTIGSL